MNCSHEERKIRKYWTTDNNDNPIQEEEYYTAATTVDIDLHRYKCTRCNTIFYYSGAARAFFEDGKLSNVRGLDGMTSAEINPSSKGSNGK